MVYRIQGDRLVWGQVGVHWWGPNLRVGALTRGPRLAARLLILAPLLLRTSLALSQHSDTPPDRTAFATTNSPIRTSIPPKLRRRVGLPTTRWKLSRGCSLLFVESDSVNKSTFTISSLLDLISRQSTHQHIAPRLWRAESLLVHHNLPPISNRNPTPTASACLSASLSASLFFSLCFFSDPQRDR